MTEEIRNMINCITFDDLSKIERMDIASPERTKAISDVKTLIELDLKDAEACTKAYKEEQLVQTESKKSKLEIGKALLSFAGGLGGTFLLIAAGQKGWFIDKTALGNLPKTKW